MILPSFPPQIMFLVMVSDEPAEEWMKVAIAGDCEIMAINGCTRGRFSKHTRITTRKLLQICKKVVTRLLSNRYQDVFALLVV
jgi:hypothetical protein